MTIFNRFTFLTFFCLFLSFSSFGKGAVETWREANEMLRQIQGMDPDAIQNHCAFITWARNRVYAERRLKGDPFTEQEKRSFIHTGLEIIDYIAKQDSDRRMTEEARAALSLLDYSRAYWTLEDHITVRRQIADLNSKHLTALFSVSVEREKNRGVVTIRSLAEPAQAEMDQLTHRLGAGESALVPLAMQWLTDRNRKEETLKAMRLAAVKAILENKELPIALPLSKLILSKEVGDYLVRQLQTVPRDKLSSTRERIQEMVFRPGQLSIVHPVVKAVSDAISRSEQEYAGPLIVTHSEESKRLDRLLTQWGALVGRMHKVSNFQPILEGFKTLDPELIKNSKAARSALFDIIRRSPSDLEAFSSMFAAEQVVKLWPNSEEAVFAVSRVFEKSDATRLYLGFELLDYIDFAGNQKGESPYVQDLTKHLSRIVHTSKRPKFAAFAKKALVSILGPCRSSFREFGPEGEPKGKITTP